MSEKEIWIGERLYKSRFVVSDGFKLSSKDKEVLQDFLYKICYNIENAYKYLQLIYDSYRYISTVSSKDIDCNSLIFTIYESAINQYYLVIRRIIDSGKRSLTTLLENKHITEKVLNEKELVRYKKQIDMLKQALSPVYDKVIAHQDDVWIVDTWKKANLDYRRSLKDIKQLEKIHYKVVSKLCCNYLRAETKFDFKDDLARIFKPMVDSEE